MVISVEMLERWYDYRTTDWANYLEYPGFTLEQTQHFLGADFTILLRMLGDIYGVEPGKEDDVDNFLNGIAGGKND